MEDGGWQNGKAAMFHPPSSILDFISENEGAATEWCMFACILKS
jgi:hypothetical protein